MSQPGPSDTTITNTTTHRVARLATEMLAPWVWLVALPLAVAWPATGHQLGATLLWGLLVGITASLIPMAVIVRGARRGKWEGHHVTNRAGRLIPLATVVGSLGVGLAALLIGGAPSEMVVLAAVKIATVIISLAITFGLHFKISMHAGVATLATVVLIVTYGPALAALLLLVLWVCWSRVHLHDHTLSEALSGVVLGLVAGGGYWLVATAL